MSIITIVLRDESERGDTKLHEAIAAGDLTKVQELIVGGADVHYIGDWGCTPLELATELGYLDIVRTLLAAGSQVAFGVNSAPLEIAVKTGQIDIVKTLIEADADINQDLGNNHTVLMTAATSGHLNIVRFLIEKGADANAIREDGASALLCAASNGWQEVFDCLALLTSKEILKQAAKKLPAGLIYRQRKDDKVIEEFVLAAGEGRIDDVKKAIVAGVDINAIDSKTDEGWTALMAAAKFRNIKAVVLLLQAGADINAKNIRGDTALSRAKEAKNQEIIQILLEVGAKED